MDHRRLIDPLLRSLEPRRAGHLLRLARLVDEDARLAERRHLVYALLARAGAGLPPELSPELTLAELAEQVAAEGGDLAHAVYAAAAGRQPGDALDQAALRLLGRVADRCLALMASGEVAEPERAAFRFDPEGGTTTTGAFPYSDLYSDDDQAATNAGAPSASTVRAST